MERTLHKLTARRSQTGGLLEQQVVIPVRPAVAMLLVQPAGATPLPCDTGSTPAPWRTSVRTEWTGYAGSVQRLSFPNCHRSEFVRRANVRAILDPASATGLCRAETAPGSRGDWSDAAAFPCAVPMPS